MSQTVIVQAPGTAVLQTAKTQAVVARVPNAVVVKESAPLTVVVTRGIPGPTGPPGPDGGNVLQRAAGETLSALRAVYELDGAVRPLDAGDADHIDLLLGITITAAAAGQPINVQRAGSISDAAWSWTPGSRVHLGANGALTQSPPVDGFDVLIGTAVSPTSLLLNLQEPIELE